MNHAGAVRAADRTLRPRMMWLAGLLLLGAVIAVTLGGALARVNQQRAGIEHFLRDQTGLDVRFGGLRVQLGFYGPEAVFSDVSFRRPGSSSELLHAASVTARFEYFRVLRQGELQPGLITLRDADIDLTAAGFEPLAASGRIAAAADARSAVDLLATMEQQMLERIGRIAALLPEARLRFESVTLRMPRTPGTADTWALQSPLIALDKTAQGLRAAGTVRMPERLGHSVWFRLDTPPDAHSAGHIELRTRDLVLPQWRALAGISADVDGSLDVRLDAHWRHAHVQTAEARVHWRTLDSAANARLQFDRSGGKLTADSERMSLAALRQLWEAFDPAAQGLVAFGDIEPSGDVTELRLIWMPDAPSGERSVFTARIPALRLHSRQQDLELLPLRAVLRASERGLRLGLSADAAELRRTDAAPGSGRLLAIEAGLESHGTPGWLLRLHQASLGPRRQDDPEASDRILPPLDNLRGELRSDGRARWQATLSGVARAQAFHARVQGNGAEAVLQADAPADWQALLRLTRDQDGSWRTVAGRIELGAARPTSRLPRRGEIRIAGRLPSADLVDLEPLLTRWPANTAMPSWRGSVRVAQLRLAGRALGAGRVAVSRDDDGALLRVSSARLAGDLRLRDDGGWAATLQRAHFDARADESALSTKLLALGRPVSLAVADLRFGERRLGKLAVQLVPDHDDLSLQRLSLTGRSGVLRGSGRCLRAEGSCNVQLALLGGDIGVWLADVGQGAPLHSSDLRGDFHIEWPLKGTAPWLESLSGRANLRARTVSIDDGDAAAPWAGWAAGLRTLPTQPAFERLDAQLRWQPGQLKLASLVLRQGNGALRLSGDLDYQTRRIDQLLVWQAQDAGGAIPASLAALETAALQQVPALVGAVGGVERWVSGAASPQRWRVSGTIDAPNVEPLVAE